MRKIGTLKEIEDKRKRNMLYISAFMLFVLVIGTVGYGFISNPNINNSGNNITEINNEGKVIEQNGRWAAAIKGQTYYFSNSPESTQNISVNINSNLFEFSGINLYIDANNTAVINEIGLALNNHVGKFSEGCYGKCERDLPEKDCTDNLIVWKDNVNNIVYQEDKCIFIEGDLRAVDAFLYKILELN